MTPYAREMQREPCANRAREEAEVAGTFGAGVAMDGGGVVVRGFFLVGVLVTVLLEVLVLCTVLVVNARS